MWYFYVTRKRQRQRQRYLDVVPDSGPKRAATPERNRWQTGEKQVNIEYWLDWVLYKFDILDIWFSVYLEIGILVVICLDFYLLFFGYWILETRVEVGEYWVKWGLHDFLGIFTSFRGMEGVFWGDFLNLGREPRWVEDLSLLVDSVHGIPGFLNFTSWDVWNGYMWPLLCHTHLKAVSWLLSAWSLTSKSPPGHFELHWW